MKSKITKTIALLLSIVLAVASLPLMVGADAEIVTGVKVVDYPRADSDWGSGWGNNAIDLMDGWY